MESNKQEEGYQAIEGEEEMLSPEAQNISDEEDPTRIMTEKESITREFESERPATTQSPNSLTLELGDIIEINAPTNRELHEITAMIEYIDDNKIRIINIATTKTYQLNIAEDGYFTDESITQIILLNRSDEKGYSRQNGLFPRTWVDIHFGGDIPAIITGEITNLDEDMIEITTYPELRTIYIDFEYKGVPEHIPIDKIVIRPIPESAKKFGTLSSIRQQLEEGEIMEPTDDEFATTEYLESGESIITIPETAVPEGNIRELLHELYIDANAVVFGQKLEEIAQLVEVKEGEQRFGIDAQVNDLMDEMLSTIPNSQRTKLVLDNIHMLIARFKQLRENFSMFDDSDNAYDAKRKGMYYKPLIQHIQKLDTNLRWLMPVVTNRKKIYDTDGLIESPDVIRQQLGVGLRTVENLQSEYYDKNSKDPVLEYTALNSLIQDVMIPFVEPAVKDTFLDNIKVLTDIDVIVDNLEDFYSTVFSSTSDIIRRQFVIQRYNLGLSHLKENVMKSGKTVYTPAPMTSNDTMTVRSLLMLPSPVIKYSSVALPMTNILDKATLHQTPFYLFRLLRKNIDILPQIVDDLTTELDYEKMEEETKMDFLSGIKEFTLAPDTVLEDRDKFHKFLEVIIPKTRFLIRAIRKYIHGKLSLVDIVRQLEPFMIYTDDINYSQYQEIRYFIKTSIIDSKKAFDAESTSFTALRKLKVESSTNNNETHRIETMFQAKTDLANGFKSSYLQKTTGTMKSSAELLSNIYELDNGVLYSDLLQGLTTSTVIPSKLLDALAAPEIDDMSAVESIKPQDCARRFLAKRYKSISSLQSDNNNDEIYYDAEFDDTPYDILKSYKDEQKKMLPDLFVDFLAENLIHKHDCPSAIAKELATTLIAKKKRVTDGEYAILEIRPQLPRDVDRSTLSESEQKAIDLESDARKKIQYYRRLKNIWVRDEDIGDESFIDNNTLFCNVRSDCFKNQDTAVCENVNDAASRMKHIARKKMAAEFQNRVSITVDELETNLETRIASHLKLLEKKRFLTELRQYKSNNLAFALGNLVRTTEVIVSPHMKLRDMILGQDDFSKKQFDICRLVERFCRQPMVDELHEDPHWLYCKDTNSKLFPRSIYELASVFITGGDYAEKQMELCHSIGVLSDDGDSYVDKHSGFVLRKMDFSSEEGFDITGFKVTTHDILEKDLGAIMMELVGKKERRVFENETSEMIYNVYLTVCSNIDIPMEGIDEFVLRTSLELIDKYILSEESYKKKSAKYEKEKGKVLQPYKNYRGETMILIIASILLVAIQTAVPSFQTKKTFPGCIRSFSGYPLNGGVEDLTGIQYIACVLEKTKSSVSPWNSIQKYNASTLAKRMRDIIDNYVIKRSDIMDKYVEKRNYILLNPELTSPDEHNIAKWVHFLPPVVSVSITKTLRNVSTDFKRELLEQMRKGNHSQQESINVIHSKLVQYGYALIETINSVVKNKDLVLKTSAKIPFLENACCNESSTENATNPIFYFNEENSNINLCIAAATQLAITLKDIKALSIAASFYHPMFTGIKYPAIPTGHLEENIYAAIIWYCNIDRTLPIPDKYKMICSEKPANYNRFWSIQEKVEFFKKNGKRYDVEHLLQLMKLVNQQNIVVVDKPRIFSPVDPLRDIVEHLNMTRSTIIAEPLQEHLMAVLDAYRPKVMMDEPSDKLDALKNYLIGTNNRLYRGIMTFFDKHGNLSNLKYNQLHDFLFNIQKWNVDRPKNDTELYYDEGLYSATQFIQNAIQNMSKVYPSILLNDAGFYKKVHKHWGLSDKHQSDVTSFIAKYYEKIEKFKQDRILIRLLQEVGEKLTDLNLFAENIPIFTDIVKNMGLTEDGKPDIRTFHLLFDKPTVYMLFSYCFYSTIYEYISCADEPDLLRADREEFKVGRRGVIRENADPSEQLSSQHEMLDESLIEGDMDLQEVQIRIGNVTELKGRVGELLLAFMDVEKKNKEAIDFSYDQVIQKIRRSKDNEKKGIISYLGNMSIEERRIEEMFKTYKLGRWNIGQQKGLVQYDKEFYDREAIEENIGVDNEMETDANGLDADAEKQAELEDETERFGIDGLGSNFMDGGYYSEDAEDEYGDYEE